MFWMKSAFLYLFLGFFLIVISFSFFSRFARVERVSFSTQGSGLKPDEQKKLIEELERKTAPYKGMWVWSLPIHKLKKIIRSHPQVKQVRISRTWPNRFLVLLLPEKPMFLIMGNKVFYPTAVDGELLEPVNSSKAPDLPFLRGAEFFKQKNLREKIARLFLHLPKKGLFSQSNISEIAYSKNDQNFYMYLLQSGRPVRIGERLSEFRPDRVESVLKYLEQKKIKWRVIDARFYQKVIVSLDKDS